MKSITIINQKRITIRAYRTRFSSSKRKSDTPETIEYIEGFDKVTENKLTIDLIIEKERKHAYRGDGEK